MPPSMVPTIRRSTQPVSRRWDIFVLSLFLLYTAHCLYLGRSFPDTLPKYIPTVCELWLFYRLGKNPRKAPLATYLLMVPFALYSAVVGNYYAHKSYEFPTAQFIATLVILLGPVVYCLFRTEETDRPKPLLPFLYIALLFGIPNWRVGTEYVFGAYVHYDFSVSYGWMSVILAQIICCTPAMRRAIRMLLVRFSITRTTGVVLLGIVLISLWDWLVGCLFQLLGVTKTVTISPFGIAVLQSDYGNLFKAVYSHLMLITGIYIYTAMSEEIFFRFILPSAIKRHFRARLGPGAAEIRALWLSALLFSAMHWQQSNPIWTKLLFCTGTGIIFALLLRWGKSLQAPILVHAITNDGPHMTW